ncbi:MAG: sll1863 family stress response protein [Bacteriovorax sp.]
MKKGTFILLLSTFFVSGHQSSFAQETSQKKEEAKEKIKEAKQAVSDYTYAQKEEFVSKMKLELDGLKKDLADLETKAKKASSTAKVEADNKIQKVKLDVKKLNDQIETVKGSSESEWEKIKNRFNDSMSEAKDAVAKSRKWLSEKIAP